MPDETEVKLIIDIDFETALSSSTCALPLFELWKYNEDELTRIWKRVHKKHATAINAIGSSFKTIKIQDYVEASANIVSEYGPLLGLIPMSLQYENQTKIEILCHPSYRSSSLLHSLQFHSCKLNYLTKLFISYQIFAIVGDLHQHRISHQNINLNNIFVNKEGFVQFGAPHFSGILDRNKKVSSNQTVAATTATTTVGNESNKREENSSLCLTTMQWLRGEMNNFDYLMYLNKVAGRRYGDPTNHYMLPWVTDFSIKNGGYRDLTKSKYRLNKGDAHMDMQYEHSSEVTSLASSGHNYVDNADNNLPWNCSSDCKSMERSIQSSQRHHISDAMCNITYYSYKARQTPKHVLCRIVRAIWRPKEYPLSMQRMYAWTPDECIPEFFTDPNLFKSIHNDMDDLQFPDWCSNVEEFLNYHKMILESDFVSENLHHWIDITFGYKLLGSEAVDAKNVHLRTESEDNQQPPTGIVCIFRRPHPKRFNNVINRTLFGPVRIKLEKILKKRSGIKVPPSDDSTQNNYPSIDETNGFNLLEQYETLYDFLIDTSASSVVPISLEALNEFPNIYLSQLMFEDCLAAACTIVELFLFDYFTWDSAMKHRLDLRVMQARRLLIQHNQRLPKCIVSGLQTIFQPRNKDIKSIDDLQTFCPSVHQCCLHLFSFPNFMPELRRLLLTVSVYLSPWLQRIENNCQFNLSNSPVTFSQRFDYFLAEWRDFIMTYGSMTLSGGGRGGILCETYAMEPYPTISSSLSGLMEGGSSGNMAEIATDPMHTLVLPLFLHLLSLPHFAISVLWHSLHHVCQLLDHKTKLTSVLPAVLRVYNSALSPSCETKIMKLYDKSFLRQLILQFGFDNFLHHVTPVLVETVAQANNNNHSDPHPPNQDGDHRIIKEFSSLGSVASDNIVWLSERLGPVITARFFTKNLLRMLVICYSPNVETRSWRQFKLKENSALNLNEDNKNDDDDDEDDNDEDDEEECGGGGGGGLLKCDYQADALIVCLRRIVHLYGTSFVLTQYLPFIKQAFRCVVNSTHVSSSPSPISDDTRRRTAEGNMIAAIMLLQHLLLTPTQQTSQGLSITAALLSDNVLMNILHSDILQAILYKAIDACIHPHCFLFSGAHGRRLLATRICDTICLLSVRLGFEKTRGILTPLLQRFFTLFSLAHYWETRINQQLNCVNIESSIQSSKSINSNEPYNFLVNVDQNGETSVTPIAQGPISPPITMSLMSSSPYNSLESTLKQRSPLTDNLQQYWPWCLEDISDDIRQQWSSTFTASLAYRAYIPMCRMAGDIHMSTSLHDAAFIEDLVQQHERGLAQKCGNNLNLTYRGPKVMLQEMKLRGLSTPVRIDDAEQPRVHIMGEFDSNMRRLNDYWSAYWQHNIGIDTASFDLKQIALAEFEGHTGSVRVLQVLPNETSFLSCGIRDKTVRLWSLNSAWSRTDVVSSILGTTTTTADGQNTNNTTTHDSLIINECFRFARHRRGVFAAEFMPNERMVASCDGENMHLWDPFTGQSLRKVHSPTGMFVAMTTTSKAIGSTQVFLVDQDGRLSIIDTRIGDMVYQITVSSTPLSTYNTPAGQSESTTTSNLDPTAIPNVNQLIEHQRRPYDNQINLPMSESASAQSYSSLSTSQPAPPVSGSIRHLHCLSTGHTAVWSYSTGSVMSLDLRSGQTIQAWRAHQDEILHLNSIQSANGDADWLLTAGSDQGLHAWDLVGQYTTIIPKRYSFQGHQSDGSVHFYTPLGDDLIVGLSHNRLGCYRSLNNYSTFGKLSPSVFKGNISALTALPLNRLILVASENGKIVLLY